jgi:hypothetical protein
MMVAPRVTSRHTASDRLQTEPVRSRPIDASALHREELDVEDRNDERERIQRGTNDDR